MADRLGQQLGNYRLVRLLGQGGFADVYLGEHIHLNSQAAIKVLQMRLVGSALEQFRNEGRAIASLVHPNIVRVFDFGVDDGTPFLVMDYAPNGTLRQHYPKGAVLSPATVLPHFVQVARALQYAHDRKLMHRDIKPENMLLGPNNEVLLSDFGLALPAQSTGSQTVKEMAGTLPYMAPEQINGRPRFASDQYALGIVLYEWLSGERPFHGSVIEIATQHMMTPPAPLYGRVSGVSRAVEEVLFVALAKDPLKRFDRIETFAAALDQACQPTRIDSSVLPTAVSSQPPSAELTYSTSPQHLSRQNSTSEATFIKPAASLTQRSTLMATSPHQLAPVTPPTGETAQSTYIILPTAGQPTQPVSIVTSPGNAPGIASITTPSGYGSPPLSLEKAPGQHHHSAAPASTTTYSARRRRTGVVFASVLIVALALLLISGTILFLPKTLSLIRGGNGSTPTRGNSAGNAGTATQVSTSVITPTHSANGSSPANPTPTVTSIPTIIPTTPVTTTGPAITDFAGIWYNVDPNTRSWVRVEIGAQGNTLTAHIFGACTPTPCDAGSTSTTYAGSPVSMALTESFDVMNFTLTLNGNILHITTFTHFTDNSGRSDYTSQDDFSTTAPTPPITPTVVITPTGPTITDFVGVWQNVDANTRDWIRVEITAQGNTLTAHFFGACTPTPCDAGSTSTTYAGSPVSMTLTGSFATRTFTLTLNGSILHITTFTHFTDNSGRPDYTIQDDFHL
jgi:serine/threonine protein kinase